MKICAWNVCGLKSKLQNPEVLNFVLSFDIIWISEIKETLVTSVPGFDVYMNKSKKNIRRGGIMMLVKCALVPFITHVNMSIEGQIWVELSCCVGVRFGGVYIPPDDSPYHDPALLGALEGQVRDCDRVIVLGDLNARIGFPVNRNIEGKRFEYQNVKDHTVNNMGRAVMNMCDENKMLVANHLKWDRKHLGGDLSFRRSQWISEIDLCLAKYNTVDMLKNLEIRQDIKGSDHAPITLTIDIDTWKETSPTQLLERACNLGKTHTHSPCTTTVSRGPHHECVDLRAFAARMAESEPPTLDGVNVESVETAVKESCDAVNRIAKDCKKTETNRVISVQPRWKRLVYR